MKCVSNQTSGGVREGNGEASFPRYQTSNHGFGFLISIMSGTYSQPRECSVHSPKGCMDLGAGEPALHSKKPKASKVMSTSILGVMSRAGVGGQEVFTGQLGKPLPQIPLASAAYVLPYLMHVAT